MRTFLTNNEIQIIKRCFLATANATSLFNPYLRYKNSILLYREDILQISIDYILTIY